MNYRALFTHLAGMAGLLILSQQSYAAAGCAIAPGFSVQNYSAPISTSISVPRNAATGPIGSEILVSSGGPTTTVVCTYSSTGYIYFMDKLLSPGDATGTTAVYQTNVPGIGFRLWASGITGKEYSIKDTPTGLWSYGGTQWAGKNTTEQVKIYKVSVQFYVTGPVSPGNITFNSPTLTALVGPNSSNSGNETGAVTYSNLTISGSVPVTVQACETPNISVNLKEHKKSDFPSVGSTSSATAFNFAIKNCPKNLNSVNYTFKPASGITLKGSGTGQYLTLDSGSTASGVGVQVLYENGTNVPFNTKTKYTGYSTTTGGDYTIPMKARYIRTGIISPGTANSAVEFDMSYE